MSSTFLTVLNLVAAILNSGLIQSLVQAIELIYRNFSGAEKKEVALKMVSPLVPPGATPILSAAIDTQVAAFNEAGVFKHKEAGYVDGSDPGGVGSFLGPFAR